MSVIILIRHPAAFASSLKQKKWEFSFSNFLDQNWLMRDHLYPFESAINSHVNNKSDIIDQASLLWKILHYMIQKYRERHVDWLFIRHEDISMQPLMAFQDIFSYLALDFTDKKCPSHQGAQQR